MVIRWTMSARRAVAIASTVLLATGLVGTAEADPPAPTGGTEVITSRGLRPAISADGRHVAYAGLGHPESTDSQVEMDIVVADRQTGTTERIDLSHDGSRTVGVWGSSNPEMTPDARFVAFVSDKVNLVTDDTNGLPDVFVHDRQTGTTERVSVASDATEANGSDVMSFSEPAISADGRFVAFTSDATNLTADDDMDGLTDVFVHDRQTATTDRIEGAGAGLDPAISADGRYVAFDSWADDLVGGDTNEAPDVFVHDRETGETERVSIAGDGAEADGMSIHAAISADGRHLAFISSATNLVTDDTNGVLDAFVHDRETGETERVSIAGDGTQADAGFDLEGIAITPDGRSVAFSSDATNLVADDTNEEPDVFVHDRETGETERVSIADDGSQANGWHPAVSADAQQVAFETWAGVDGCDPEGAAPVAVRDRESAGASPGTKACDDMYGPVTPDSPYEMAAPGVLANDVSDGDGTLSVLTASAPQFGSVDVDGDGRFVYTPDAGFTGFDSFTYEISDGEGHTDTASAVVAVFPDPNAADDAFTTPAGNPGTIDVLRNDSPNAFDLTIVEVTDPAFGTAENQGSEVFYWPDPEFAGTDTFVYTVMDSTGNTDTAEVTVTVKPAEEPDTVQVSVSGRTDLAVAGPITSGDLTIGRDTLGVTAVSGTATLAGGTVAMDVRRLWILPLYLGSVTVRAPGATVKAPVFFATLRTAGPASVSSSSAWLDISSWPWMVNRIAWTVTDRS
ncbi:MAG: cadherin-like domain-containing protein [Acidimicrobiia bacterium]|nr:cadherin-like domain-containing protein [Acidimicrobiia bacterium]